MYTKEQLEVAKAILLNLISEDRELECELVGVCSNAEDYLKAHFAGVWVDMYDLVAELSVGWSKHSGSLWMPVEDIDCCGKWEGTNLILRIDLMKHIVGKIDKMLGEML